MALRIYNSEQVLYPNISGTQYGPLDSNFNGRLGGAYEEIIYIRNNDATKYYTNIQLSVVEVDGDDSFGIYGETGWSIKLLYGSRRPTEAEWDGVTSAQVLNLSDLGEVGSPDTSTYLPVWVRIYAPGGLHAQFRSGQSLSLSAIEEVV